MGLGPIPAIQALLKQTGMTMDDIDIVEINEAFAAQIVPCRDDLGISEEKLNPFGGAIALGHPFGMTGARIMTTLINGLRTRGGHLRHRVHVRGRRDGTGDADRAPQLAHVSWRSSWSSSSRRPAAAAASGGSRSRSASRPKHSCPS
jgi:hypothetical protein